MQGVPKSSKIFFFNLNLNLNFEFGVNVEGFKGFN